MHTNRKTLLAEITDALQDMKQQTGDLDSPEADRLYDHLAQVRAESIQEAAKKARALYDHGFGWFRLDGDQIDEAHLMLLKSIILDLEGLAAG